MSDIDREAEAFDLVSSSEDESAYKEKKDANQIEEKK